jgi:hypothetical protein
MYKYLQQTGTSVKRRNLTEFDLIQLTSNSLMMWSLSLGCPSVLPVAHVIVSMANNITNISFVGLTAGILSAVIEVFFLLDQKNSIVNLV